MKCIYYAICMFVYIYQHIRIKEEYLLDEPWRVQPQGPWTSFYNPGSDELGPEKPRTNLEIFEKGPWTTAESLIKNIKI